MNYLVDQTRRKPEGRIYFTSSWDYQNAFIAFKNQGGDLSVAVAEEKAMDSYNETFECAFSCSREQAIVLRDYLNAAFKTRKRAAKKK